MAQDPDEIVDLEAFHRKCRQVLPGVAQLHPGLTGINSCEITIANANICNDTEELLNSANSVRRMVVSWLPPSEELDAFKNFDDTNVNLESLRTRPERCELEDVQGNGNTALTCDSAPQTWTWSETIFFQNLCCSSGEC